MADIHLTADIPADAPPDVKTKMRAEVIAAGLELAVKDPEIRLRMILGEAHCKFQEIIQWVTAEIAKDELKAPGVTSMAHRFAHDPKGFCAPIKDDEIGAMQYAILEAVTAIMLRRKVASQAPEIERDASV